MSSLPSHKNKNKNKLDNQRVVAKRVAHALNSDGNAEAVFTKKDLVGGRIRAGEVVESGIVRPVPLDGDQCSVVFDWTGSAQYHGMGCSSQLGPNSIGKKVWTVAGGFGMVYRYSDDVREVNAKLVKKISDERFEVIAVKDIGPDCEVVLPFTAEYDCSDSSCSASASADASTAGGAGNGGNAASGYEGREHLLKRACHLKNLEVQQKSRAGANKFAVSIDNPTLAMSAEQIMDDRREDEAKKRFELQHGLKFEYPQEYSRNTNGVESMGNVYVAPSVILAELALQEAKEREAETVKREMVRRQAQGKVTTSSILKGGGGEDANTSSTTASTCADTARGSATASTCADTATVSRMSVLSSKSGGSDSHSEQSPRDTESVAATEIDSVLGTTKRPKKRVTITNQLPGAGASTADKVKNTIEEVSQQIPTAMDLKAIMEHSGDGTFASRDFKAGELIEWGVARRLHSLDGNDCTYVFTWSEDRELLALP